MTLIFSEVVWGHEEVPVVMWIGELWYGLWTKMGVATDPLYKPNRSIRIKIKAGQAIKPARAKHHALYSSLSVL